MTRHLSRGTIWVVLLVLIGGATISGAQTFCSVPRKNLLVRSAMTDLYLWSAFLPDVDPTRYSSPEAYLEAIRYRVLDSHYSYIDDRAASEAFFSDSTFIGFGFSSVLETEVLRVAQVFPGSPAEEAGLLRGDRITAVDGVAIATTITSGNLSGVFGPSEIGVTRDLTYLRDAETRNATLTKRAVTIPTVSNTRVIPTTSGRVGYLFFRNFVQPSRPALEAAFSDLAAAGLTDLVLDLRYNGGGLVDIAQYLASLIGGARTDGLILGSYRHNPQNAFRDEDIRMSRQPQSLQLNRLFVIASSSTASASELIVNGLRPYIPVVVVGDRTYGKPVGQYALPFCDKVLAAVAFSIRNANDEGDYYDGIAPTCAAPDDLGHALGDPEEASLREALTFIATGACSGPAPARALRLRQRPHVTSSSLDSLILAN